MALGVQPAVEREAPCEMTEDHPTGTGDASTAALLAAMGRPPVAGMPQGRLDRLHRRGVSSPLEERFGALAQSRHW